MGGVILTTVPVSLRRPGVYSEFEFVANAQNLIALPNRIVVVAEAKGGTAAFDQAIQVFSEVDADAKCGANTFAATGARMAFATGNLRGSTSEIWVAPVAEPGGGAQATETLTVAVTTAKAGNLTISIAGRLITAGVNANDSANAIATSLQAAIAAKGATLPVVATVGGAVVTCKPPTKGVNGNDIAYAVVEQPVGVTLTPAQSVAGAGVADPTNALNSLYDRRYHGVALSNHTTVDIALLLLARAVDWGYAQANYKFYFMGSRDSLGTAGALQAAANDFGINVTVCEQIPRTPIEIAAAVAETWFAHDAPNFNTDGEVIPLEPPPGAFAFTASEVESALNGGMTPLTPAGSFVKIERLVSTEITVNGAPFEPLRDMAYPRTSSWLAEQIAFAIASIQQAVETDDVLTDARDIIVEVDRAAERLGYIRDVDTFLDQIQTVFASSPAGRLNATNPHRVAGPLHQSVVHNTMYQ